MERLTKRTPNGIAYVAIADTLLKSEQEIEGSKPILEGIYAALQKLADYEDKDDIKYSCFCDKAEKQGDKCLGYSKSENDDEPIDFCKSCSKCTVYDYDDSDEFADWEKG